MNFSHSIFYDQLPDLFIAYDIWSAEDREFYSPDIVEELLSKTTIRYIKPKRIIFSNIDEIVDLSKSKSDYRNGIREGIVIKVSDGKFLTNTFKVVNNLFIRCEDFNKREIIKNKLSDKSFLF